MSLDGARRRAREPLHRRAPPQHLLDCARDECKVVEEERPLVGELREREHAVADEVRRRLGARHDEEEAEPEDLVVGELLAVDLRGDERGHEVVGGCGPSGGDDLAEVPDDRAGRGAPRLHGLGTVDVLVHDRVGPRAELLTVLWCYPDQVAHDRHRERAAERGHEIHRLTGRGSLDHRVDRLVGELAHPRLERGDGPRREAARHELAELRVARVVHHDQVGERRARLTLERDPLTGAERGRVVGGPQHVLEARERPEAAGVVVVHGRLVPEAPIDGVRVGLEDPVVGVETDTSDFTET